MDYRFRYTYQKQVEELLAILKDQKRTSKMGERVADLTQEMVKNLKRSGKVETGILLKQVVTRYNGNVKNWLDGLKAEDKG
jgi:hypothetical protein